MWRRKLSHPSRPVRSEPVVEPKTWPRPLIVITRVEAPFPPPMSDAVETRHVDPARGVDFAGLSAMQVHPFLPRLARGAVQHILIADRCRKCPVPTGHLDQSSDRSDHDSP